MEKFYLLYGIFQVKTVKNLQKFILSGIEKALKLSAVSALSQCAASLRPPESSLLGLSLSYYRTLSDRFRDTKGNPVARLKKVLESDPDEAQELSN